MLEKQHTPAGTGHLTRPAVQTATSERELLHPHGVPSPGRSPVSGTDVAGGTNVPSGSPEDSPGLVTPSSPCHWAQFCSKYISL